MQEDSLGARLYTRNLFLVIELLSYLFQLQTILCIASLSTSPPLHSYNRRIKNKRIPFIVLDFGRLKLVRPGPSPLVPNYLKAKPELLAHFNSP